MGSSRAERLKRKDPPFTREDAIKMLQTSNFTDNDTYRIIYLPYKKFSEAFGKIEQEIIDWELPNSKIVPITFRPIYRNMQPWDV